MYSITWCDKRAGGWSKSTASKEEALNTILLLFKRHAPATCKTSGISARCGAVWQMDDGRWNWFFDQDAE